MNMNINKHIQRVKLQPFIVEACIPKSFERGARQLIVQRGRGVRIRATVYLFFVCNAIT